MPSYRPRVFWWAGVLLAAGCARPLPPADPPMVAEWMQNYYGLIRAERISPPVASRVLAYAAVALYEGLAAGTPGLRSLAGQLNGLDSLPRPEPDQRYDPVLAAIAAERTVLDSLFVEGLPATRAALAGLVDSLTAARIALGIPEDVQQRSARLGTQLGEAILRGAAGDGFDSTRTKPWTPPAGRQYWVNDTPADQYTPQSLSAATDFVALDNPANTLRPGAASERGLIVNRPKSASVTTLKAVNPTGATEPWWGTLRPFVLQGDECAPPPPPQFSTVPTSELYRQAKAVYDAGLSLTEEQKQIALYWADNPGQTGTPTGHWLSIGSQLINQLHLPVDRAAEVFVLVTIAQADAFIRSWRTKYLYNHIRPRTYIRRHIDPAWEPLIPTPPFPEHTAGHSTQSSTAATVLEGLLGTAVAFGDSTNLALGHPVRRFRSFREAADEAAISRLYGGIHYPLGNELGEESGRCVGDKVLQRVLARTPQ